MHASYRPPRSHTGHPDQPRKTTHLQRDQPNTTPRRAGTAQIEVKNDRAKTTRAAGPTRIARKRKPRKRPFPNRLRHGLIRTPVVALAVLQLPSSAGFVVDRGNGMPVNQGSDRVAVG